MQRTLDVIANNHPDRATRDDMFEAVCRDCAEDVRADLVSIWLFDGPNRRIVRGAVYDSIAGTYEEDGMAIAFDRAPNYFRHIREETLIVAPDACRHPMTSELADSYFRPLGIVSMLDFIIHRPGFEPFGIVCCENRHGQRDWSDEDITYLRRIAALLALHFT